jgi:outer membrane protein assembly factor BamB
MYGQGVGHGRDLSVLSPPFLNGTVGWQAKVGTGATGWVYGQPVVGADETIYTSSWDGYVYALDHSTGATRWSFEVRKGEKIWGSPALATPAVLGLGNDSTTTIYVGGNQSLLALAARGGGAELQWSVPTGAPIFASPTVDPASGNIFIGSLGGNFYAVSPAGEILWTYKAAAPIYASAVSGRCYTTLQLFATFVSEV